MKRLMVLIIFVSFFMGCASVQEEKKYADLAKDHNFAYYFNSPSELREFSTIDEAYEYINTVQYVLKKSINKKRQQGLSAKLYGPVVNSNMPVVVVYFVNASNANGNIDFSKKADSLESSLRNAISVSNVFLVFNKDKGVSISDFYLQDDYQYSSNSQYKDFGFKGNTYKTDYPVGWNIEKAFQYLRE